MELQIIDLYAFYFKIYCSLWSLMCCNMILKYLFLWLRAPKGATAVKYTSANVWHMAARRGNVISITLRQVYHCRIS